MKPVQKDAMRVSGTEMLRAAGLRRGSRFCMVGCPPYQSFSKLSDTRGVGAAGYPRSRSVSRFGDLVAAMLPSAVVLENVSWMAGGPGRAFLDGYIEMLDGAGYRTALSVVNASAAGVPQNRKRVIAVSVRRRPLSVRRAAAVAAGSGKAGRTVSDALRGLRRPRRGKGPRGDPLHFSRAHGRRIAEVIRHVPKNGESRKEIPRRLWLECHKRLDGGTETSYGHMWWDRPSPTITRRCTAPARGRFIHPSQDRGNTLREAARLQTIPDSFDFGDISAAAVEGMIGDASPWSWPRGRRGGCGPCSRRHARRGARRALPILRPQLCTRSAHGKPAAARYTAAARRRPPAGAGAGCRRRGRFGLKKEASPRPAWEKQAGDPPPPRPACSAGPAARRSPRA